MKKENLLIIGSTGYVGSHLYEYYKSTNPYTLGSSRRKTLEMSYCDLYQPSLDFLDQVKIEYTSAIICAAIPNIAKCENDPKETFAQNVLGTLNLIRQLQLRGIKPVLFSSDIVFDGIDDLYTDQSKPNPINEYGIHKYFLEQLAPKLCDECLMIRLSKTYSVDIQDETFLHQLARRVYNEEDIRAASDLIFNPIHIDDVIKAIDMLIQNKCRGLYNVTGTETTSWYMLAKQLAHAMGKDGQNITETSIDEFGAGAKRAKKLNVRPERFLNEFPNFKFSTLEENIQNITKFYPINPKVSS